MVNFAELKKMSGKSSLDKLTAELSKLNGGSGCGDNKKDERLWYPNVDKA